MRRHMLMRLRAPLVAFGGEAIDRYGVIRDFPALSMITGMIANALGWDRGECGKHDRLQTRLLMGTRLDNSGERLCDFQTAQISRKDSGWTWRGIPESRDGGEDTYKARTCDTATTTPALMRWSHCGSNPPTSRPRSPTSLARSTGRSVRFYRTQTMLAVHARVRRFHRRRACARCAAARALASRHAR